MRLKNANITSDFKILVVDDEIGIIQSMTSMLNRSGYDFHGVTDPVEAIDKVRNDHYDLLILDYMMKPIHGDKVVEEIRKFNNDLYILLLTGHKDLVPPIQTIKALDIQGYCEKSNNFDQLNLLIESAKKSVYMMRTIKKFQEGLNKILAAVPKIYQLQPIDSILNEILNEILPFVNSKDAFILIDNNSYSSESNNSIYNGIGKYSVSIEEFINSLGHDMLEQIGYSREQKIVVRLENGIILPLINELKESIGVIYVESNDFEEGLKLLEIYTNQSAASLNNAFLHSLVNIKNEELHRTYDELRSRYIDTIEALRLTVDAKDVYTRGHSDRVAFYSVKIGQAFDLNEQELETLRAGGIFHDIGKIGTKDDILLKTDKLEDREYSEIKKHPLKGAHILASVSMFNDVVPLVKYHHERIDGKGYSTGLKGEEIPFLARIISVADAFDAMTSDRLYRSKMGIDAALDQLKGGAGTQFDAQIVEKFLEILKNFDELQKEIAHTYE
jgi:putative nucleotidyltransferase with HDIG domain